MVFRSGCVAGGVLAALLCSVSFPALSQSPQIGVTAAVNPAAEGRPPATAPRELRVGVNVVANERIVTTEGGQAQMLFLDESAFSIGPNSDVVLDEFVYDANAGTGKIALSATKGVFRVVGGKISKNTPVELKTPTATIGIRGGIALVNVAPNGATQATFLFGAQMTVSTPGGTQTVQRPGYTVSANTPGGPPSAPVQATTAQLTGTVSALEGQAPPPPGAGPAGGGQAPNDNQVQQTQLTQLGSSNAPQSVAPPGAGAPPPPPPPGTPSAASGTTTQAQQNQVGQNPSSATGGGASSGGMTPPEEVTPPPPSGLTLATQFRGRIIRGVTPSGTVGSSVEFGYGQNGDIVENVDEFEFVGTVTNGSFSGTYPETSTPNAIQFPLNAGAAFSATVSPDPFGSTGLSGTGYLFPDQDFFLYKLADSGGVQRSLMFGGVATPAQSTPLSGATFYRFLKDPVLGSNIPFLPAADGGGLLPGSTLDIADLSASALAAGSAQAAVYWDKTGSASAERAFLGVVGGTDGAGSAQGSAISLFVGRVTDGNVVEANFRGSARLATDSQPRIFSGTAESVEVSETNPSGFFGADSPKYFLLAGEDNEAEENPARQQTTEFFGNAAQQYVPASTLVRTPGSLKIRSEHTSGAQSAAVGFGGGLAGYATAVGQTIGASGQVLSTQSYTSVVDTQFPYVESALIQTSTATNKVNASIYVASPNESTIFASFGDSDDAFGSESSPTAGRSAFIDDATFGAIESDSPGSVNFNEVESGQLYLFTANMASSLPAATYCECEFTQWGFWGGQFDVGDNSFERIHAGLWVAGVPSLASEISGLTGTATYNGHVIANVMNGGAMYAAAGDLSVGVNFAAPSSSTVSIANFDGGGFSGSGLNFVGQFENVFTSGNLAGNGGQAGRSAQLVGSFMKNATGDAAAEMGGQFTATGSGYGAAGVFAGKK